MKQKIVSVLLTVAMIFSLAACGGTENKEEESSGNTEKETAEGEVTFPLDEKLTYTAFSVLVLGINDFLVSVVKKMLFEDCNIDI